MTTITKSDGICGRCGKGAHLEGIFRICNGCGNVASACRCRGDLLE